MNNFESVISNIDNNPSNARFRMQQPLQACARASLTHWDTVPIRILEEVRPLMQVAVHIRPETIGIRL